MAASSLSVPSSQGKSKAQFVPSLLQKTELQKISMWPLSASLHFPFFTKKGGVLQHTGGPSTFKASWS